MPLQEVVSLIKGPEGSIVNLAVRSVQGQTRQVDVRRAKIEVSSVDSHVIDSKISFIQIGLFNKNTGENVQRTIDEFSGKGVNGIILDLRGNKGGAMSGVVEVAEIFIQPRKTLWYYQQPGKDYEQVKTKTPQVSKLPVVVLIDGETISGGELLASVFKRSGRGILIGHKTFGEASLKEIVERSDGSYEKIERGRFFVEPDVPVTGRGIRPDVIMATDATTEQFIEKAVQVLEKKIESQIKEQRL